MSGNNRDAPVMQKADSSESRSNKQRKVEGSGEVRTEKTNKSFWDLAYKARDKIKIGLILIGAGILLTLIYRWIGWVIPATFIILIAPLTLGLERIITVPSKLVMIYKRKLKHFDLYSIPSKLFRYFDLDSDVSKLTAGSNQPVFLGTDIDLDNFSIDSAWSATANPWDLMVDEEAYMELAHRLDCLIDQDLENITMPEIIGKARAKQNSKRLDENNFDDLERGFDDLPKGRPTEAREHLRKMKKYDKEERKHGGKRNGRTAD